MGEITALEVLANLKASITKQWGEIPIEIKNEISQLEILLTPPPAPEPTVV